MKRKFLGMFLLFSTVALLAACSGSNSNKADDCLLDKTSVNCDTDMENPDEGTVEE